jgi:threonine dehydratase
MFAVTLPEQPGALQTFCHEVINDHNISEFNYRLHNRVAAHILVGINVADDWDKQKFMAKMDKSGYHHVDLSNDDLTKEHLRHMIGGSTPAIDEHVYEVTFPERPRALSNFLQAIGTDWNISLFHYRSAASDSGSVLIGFEDLNKRELETRLKSTSFVYTEVTNTAGAKLLVTNKVD